MRAALLAILAFFTMTVCSFAQQQSCDSILSGLISNKSTLSDDQFEKDYINWMNSNEFGSSESYSKANASLGISLPIDGIPVDFTGAYENNKFSGQSYGKALATYLSQHDAERHHFFQTIRDANPTVVSAWTHCHDMQDTSPGLFCSVSQTDNPNELEVSIKYNPAAGDNTIIKIKRVKYPADRVRPSEDYKNYELKVGFNTLTFKRTSLQSGRIQIVTNNTRYSCGSSGEMRFLSLVKETAMSPGCERVDEHGKCIRCVFNLAITATGPAPQETTKVCVNMPPKQLVNVRLQSQFFVTNRDPGSDCWLTYELGSDSNKSHVDFTNNAACNADIDAESGFGAVPPGGNAKASVNMFRCQWGAVASKTCKINGRLYVFTADGQP